MTDAPTADSGPEPIADLDDVAAPDRGRAVAVAAIATVVVLCFVFMVLRLRIRSTSYDGVCNMVAAPTRTC